MAPFPLTDLRSAFMLEILPFLRITVQMPETKDYRMRRKNHTGKGEARLIFRSQMLCMAYLCRSWFTCLNQGLQNKLHIFIHTLNKTDL